MSQIVKINVGGTHFETYKSTLENLEFFKTYFASNYYKPGEPIFIDRNPKGFEALLDSLRDATKHFPTKYWSDLEYYGLKTDSANGDGDGDNDDNDNDDDNDDDDDNNENNNEGENDDESQINLFDLHGGIITQMITTEYPHHLFGKTIKPNAFLKGTSPVVESISQSTYIWIDESTLLTVTLGQDIGNDLMLNFKPREIFKKYLNTHKDYYDLIERVNIYSGRENPHHEKKNDITVLLNNYSPKPEDLFETCKSSELYFRFRYAQQSKNNKTYDFSHKPNIIPIFVAEQKISTKFTESHLNKFEDPFFVTIKFKKDFFSKIDNIELASVGYNIIEIRENTFKQTNSMTIYRWLEHIYSKFTHSGPRSLCFNVFLYLTPEEERYVEQSQPIDTLFIKFHIPTIDKKSSTDSCSELIKSLTLKLNSQDTKIILGESASLEYIKDDVTVLWYTLKLYPFIYPSRHQSVFLDIHFWDDVNELISNKRFKIKAYSYEVVNYFNGFTKRSSKPYLKTPLFAGQRQLYIEKEN